jgi:hypothetical protein
MTVIRFLKRIIAALISLMHVAKAYKFETGLPPRFQLENNAGYCGEVSTIMAGLKYGQYFSQYDVREIAAAYQTNAQTDTEYLVGVNDQFAAKNLRLNTIEFDSSTPGNANGYLAWLKSMTRSGYAPTLTVYMNYYKFYGSTNPDAGDAEYDHIVSVSSIYSAYDDDQYHDDDIITIEDHGLWAPRTTGPVYLFNFTFADFKGTRQQANAKNGAIYTLPSSPTTKNYGIAHTGPTDTSNELLPVTVATSVNYEDPAIARNSNTRPDAMPLNLTVTVSNLSKGVQYVMYRYDDEAKVPTGAFNRNSGAAKRVYAFQGDETGVYTMTESFMSSDKVIFRCVRNSAP